MKYFHLVILLISTITVSARSIVLPVKGQGIYIKNVQYQLNTQPGDTLLIPTDFNIANIGLFEVHGSATMPIVITTDGKNPDFVIGGYKSYAFKMGVSSYFKLYRIKVNEQNAGGIGIRIGEGCTDYTIDHCEVSNASIGIQCKWDPDKLNINSALNYPTGAIKNVVITNNYVHDLTNEGYYIGHTFSGLANSVAVPAPIIGLKFYNNKSENTGWDGAQFTNAQNCDVRNVQVINAGIAKRGGQSSGMPIQDATTGTFDSIYVNGSTGSGIQIFSKGDIKITNVWLINTAQNVNSSAIFVDNRSDRGMGLPPQKLFLKNITIKGGSRFPLYVLNGDRTAVPGKIINLTYTGFNAKIVDNNGDEFIGGSEGASRR